MTFTIPGLDDWMFRLVLIGRRMVLEAIQGELQLSAEMGPLDSRVEQAHQLVNQPRCLVDVQGSTQTAT
jgi:hypothetical protein